MDPLATALFVSFVWTNHHMLTLNYIGDPEATILYFINMVGLWWAIGGFAGTLPFCSALSIFSMRLHISADIKGLVLRLAVVHGHKYKEIPK